MILGMLVLGALVVILAVRPDLFANHIAHELGLVVDDVKKDGR